MLTKADSLNLTLYNCLGWVAFSYIDPYNFFLQSILAQDQLNYQQLLNVHSVISTGFSALQGSMESWFEIVGDQISRYIYNMQVSLGNKISNFQLAVDGWFQYLMDKMEAQFSDMITFLIEKFKGVTDRLDKLIGGTTEGDELSQGAADLEDQVGEIHDFEQSQQAVLDDNFDAIQGAVAFTGFTAALAFVQRYINLSWAGIQSFSVIYTLPIFIGLFFFVCGRIPGATRLRSRPPKDGGSA